MTTDRVARLEMEKKALVQRIAHLRKRERLQESIIRKLQVRVNQLEEVLENYLEFSESVCCQCPNETILDYCDSVCELPEFKTKAKELLGKEVD